MICNPLGLTRYRISEVVWPGTMAGPRWRVMNAACALMDRVRAQAACATEAELSTWILRRGEPMLTIAARDLDGMIGGRQLSVPELKDLLTCVSRINIRWQRLRMWGAVADIDSGECWLLGSRGVGDDGAVRFTVPPDMLRICLETSLIGQLGFERSTAASRRARKLREVCEPSWRGRIEDVCIGPWFSVDAWRRLLSQARVPGKYADFKRYCLAPIVHGLNEWDDCPFVVEAETAVAGRGKVTHLRMIMRARSPRPASVRASAGWAPELVAKLVQTYGIDRDGIDVLADRYQQGAVAEAARKHRAFVAEGRGAGTAIERWKLFRDAVDDVAVHDQFLFLMARRGNEERVDADELALGT